MRKLNNLRLLLLILFQELSPQMIRCFKDVFSLMLILTVTDQERTTSKFQSTVPTEQELHPILEMVLQLLMVTMDPNQTMSLTHQMDQRKTLNSLGLNKTSQDKLQDILFNTPTPHLNSLVLSGRKYSLKLIASI